MAGGGGDDFIEAREGRRDLVDCGPGSDRILADDVDEIDASCERGSVWHAPWTVDSILLGTRFDDVFYLEKDEVFGLVEGTGTTVHVKPLVASRRAEFERYRRGPSPDSRCKWA
jgi:hypothetical protein